MNRPRLALVFGGGGARAAYQVGFLRWLARRMPDLDIPVLTGVSMGAINAVHLARSAAPLPQSVHDLASLWKRFTTDRVARSDWGWIGSAFVRLAARVVGARPDAQPSAPLDTRPLSAFLREALECDGERIQGIAENLAVGRLAGVAITTSDLASGSSTTWIQAREAAAWRDGAGLRGVDTVLTLDHLMATMAVPLLFPAVRLDRSWHADGVIRQSAPLLPAMRLGADRIVSISCRHVRDSAAEPDEVGAAGYPALAQIGGVLLHSVLESMLDVNARLLTEIQALRRRLPEQDRPEEPTAAVLVMRPSRDLGEMAMAYETRLPLSSRLFAGGMGRGNAKNLDLYSNLVFHPEYVGALIDLGERDAEARRSEIEALIAGP